MDRGADEQANTQNLGQYNIIPRHFLWRGIKMYRQELWFLCSACRPMMLYISMKFHENILNGFQVKEQTQNNMVKF